MSLKEALPTNQENSSQGDAMVEINGAHVGGKTLSEVSDMIGDKEGTAVRITVERRGVRREPISLMLKRVMLKSVDAVDLDESTTYVRIALFLPHTPEELLENIAKHIGISLSDGRIFFFPQDHDFVLDFRGNPGGLLNVAGIISYLSLMIRPTRL